MYAPRYCNQDWFKRFATSCPLTPYAIPPYSTESAPCQMNTSNTLKNLMFLCHRVVKKFAPSQEKFAPAIKLLGGRECLWYALRSNLPCEMPSTPLVLGCEQTLILIPNIEGAGSEICQARASASLDPIEL